MCLNLGLFPQTLSTGLSTEHNGILYLYKHY